MPYFNMSLNRNNINDVIKVFNDNSSFLVISHVSPDGDTIGSAAALCYALRSIGKKCVHVFDGSMSHNMSKFEVLTKHIGKQCKCDVVVAVDCADITRLGKFKDVFENAQNTVVIDHHKTNAGFGSVNYIQDYPACAQCIFQILDELGIAIDQNIAQCLYFAFLTDTGRFSHNDVNQMTMEYVSRLYDDFDIKISDINREMYDVRTYSKTKLLAKSLTNLEQWFDGRVTVIFLNNEEYQPFNSEDCDTEGIVNYALNVGGCKVAIFAYEKSPRTTKVSFRSVDPRYDVSKIAANFGGGGHIQAAGCTIEQNCDKVKALIYDYIKNMK